jgi:hypothetical protein
MSRLAIILLALVFSPRCFAETWVEVTGGAFTPSSDSLVQIRATLQHTVAATVAPWSGYLIQYRGAIVNGQRAIEIHGSCHFDTTNTDLHSQFYDEAVSDGGKCYFLVYFVVATRRYSNVVFHGYG